MTRPPIAPDQPNRRALVLPGGGMRVAYQAGAVQALHEEGLRFSHADGTSGGLMNLAALLSGVEPVDLARRWRTLRPAGFISPLSLRGYLGFPNLPALGDFDGIVTRVFPHLGIDAAAIRNSTGVSAYFNICDFGDKTVTAIPARDVQEPLLLAGISLPLLTPAVQYGDKTWTDAVWIQDSNLLQAVRDGANELWVVWCIGNTANFKRGFLNQYVHMIEMSAIGWLNAELAEIARMNAAIGEGERPYGHDKPIVVHLIKPEHPIPLDPDYLAGKVSGEALVDQGYMDASRYLKDITADGISLDSTATKMIEPASGVSFRETMSGRISFDTNDPIKGYSDRNTTPIVLRATVNIRDIAAFVRSADRRADMCAHLYSPRLGFTLPSTSSNFQLFSPSDKPDTVEMVYETGFHRDGKHYWFSGRKSVRKGPVWRLWRDTTTLFVHVHEGQDCSGQVVGAGILRLGLFDFASLIETLHARDAVGLWERLRTVATFARFFSVELWRIYGFGRRT
ncbi:patatin-like phospholipase family protein [Sinorhizobium medicae]|nr:patatin-like phospholipase family protein [Sinorhizobium medicae]MDX0797076.1 patatin-like phospholipase family protein [Sinorhizobium medicae]